MDQAMMQAMQNMTPDQAKAMLEAMTPEQREQMRRVQEGMLDLKHLSEVFKPSPEDPDAEVSLLKVVRALATAPLLSRLPQDPEQKEAAEKAIAACTDEVLKKMETAFVDAGYFTMDALAECDALERRNTLLLYYHMNQNNMTDLAKEVPPEVDAVRAYVNNLATKLLVKLQMLMPQQRLVQPTLAVASASALISNALWSHTDEKALTSMRAILAEDGLPFPKLSLKATAGPKATQGEGEECAAGQHVLTTVHLTREHASDANSSAPPPTPNNPQGILEAYWLYIEGLKPEGTPNSLIAAQPMTVTDLSQAVIKAEAPFQAPPTPGKYTLRVHVVSTSIIGIHSTVDVSFTVVEDDVPDLQ